MAVVGGPSVSARIRRRELAIAGLAAIVFGAAPTVGDVGACGRSATLLDETTFAKARKTVDCQRCTQCRFDTQTCTAACNPNAPTDVAWPPSCEPLEHDGEVCAWTLWPPHRRGDYAAFGRDVGPTLPSECDFCHDVSQPATNGDF